MTYQLVNQPSDLPGNCAVKKVIEGQHPMYIPSDASNADYQEYLEWVSEGNTPIPADS
jgi:hypothetical protein|tara:strand:- start:111 stop:284 length:174 start_codon:yes stop_codon:yes gene_type:complete